MTRRPRTVVVGGGILGLAVAERLVRERPGTDVMVLEKEPGWASHQTGRNSGVIHSGLYYPPASAKARWCREGVAELVDLARTDGVRYEITGKLVVAVDPAELPRLDDLARRGRANGLDVETLT
ncbi:MAG: FAD-dependent oxidoreductase, partial [Ornithinibacter sp.]